MTSLQIRDQIVADIDSTYMNYKNCSEAVWTLKDMEEQDEQVKKYFEEIVNACATGKVFDLLADKYINTNSFN